MPTKLSSNRSQQYMNLLEGLAGSAFVELCWQGRFRLDGKKLELIDSAEIGNPLLDRILAFKQEAKQPADLTPFFTSFVRRAAIPDIFHWKRNFDVRDLVLSSLLEKGMDTSAWSSLREQVRNVALQGAAADPRLRALVALARACHVLKVILTKEEQNHAYLAAQRLYPIDWAPWTHPVFNCVIALVQAIMSEARNATQQHDMVGDR